MTHPSEQWFRVYVFEPGIAGLVVDPKTKEITVGWVKPPRWELASKTAHVHHPDAYHPSVRVRIAHHREMLHKGTLPAACGEEQDPRLRFVEDHDLKDRCSGCIAATEAAKKDHAIALAELEQKAAEAKAAAPKAEDFDQEEIPTGH